MNKKGIKGFNILTICVALFLGGCKAGKEASSSKDSPIPVIQTKPMIKGGEDFAKDILKASVFRMSGDYAGNVAITLNPDGTIAYYPDPIDITANSAPYPLGGGWYLNRQGIGPDSQFTTYTFEEYRLLPAPPTHEQLLEAVIPGAYVTEFIEIPVSALEAISDPESCRQYLPQ